MVLSTRREPNLRAYPSTFPRAVVVDPVDLLPGPVPAILAPRAVVSNSRPDEP